jgi:hypothetical protein
MFVGLTQWRIEPSAERYFLFQLYAVFPRSAENRIQRKPNEDKVSLRLITPGPSR